MNKKQERELSLILKHNNKQHKLTITITKNKNKMKTLLNILGIIYITGVVLSIITLVLIACKVF